MNPMGFKECRNFIKKKKYAETHPPKQNRKSKLIKSANTSLTLWRILTILCQIAATRKVLGTKL
jgi:hypothetical protein